VGGGGVVVDELVSGPGVPAIVVLPNPVFLVAESLWCSVCTATAAIAMTIRTVATIGVTVNSRLRRGRRAGPLEGCFIAVLTYRGRDYRFSLC
jgi:hypothetical protein